jgi:hypothetical protein
VREVDLGVENAAPNQMRRPTTRNRFILCKKVRIKRVSTKDGGHGIEEMLSKDWQIQPKEGLGR